MFCSTFCWGSSHPDPDWRQRRCPRLASDQCQRSLAHLNSLRQQMIREAGEQLAKQLGSLCPRCSAPGYAIARSEPGLSCADCDLSTPLAAAYIWECPACEYQERIATNQLADPGHCERCNP